MSFNRFGLETASNLIPPFHSSGTTSTVSRPPSYAGLSVCFMHLSLNCTSPVGEGWGFNPPECHPLMGHPNEETKLGKCVEHIAHCVYPA